ncbi:MAG: hypothetical protein C4532_20085 [Candidatus Abyssobacteria bacterium SURF_17]|uniref:Right handed beta helix domain-containing protein n=1 Tax=Candidatus Abyssobacteria bacterium SURF_17 TaxID=2093361 RepID=A0A419EMS2_9BACT|nr:MAG: hypothetical protein C4532_20085 [Candidatus Abyssubacteria bacterium SURF_17]
MSRATLTATVISVLLLFQSTAVANTHYVPDSFSAIQTALDAAASGDTIIIRDGRYTGAGNKNLDFSGKALTLRSENGPRNCIIDCEGSGSGFFFHNGEGTASVLDGFTIVNGGDSGIVLESQTSPIIRNCIITGNSASPNGGGIYCGPSASPTLINCTITRNSARYGGGIFCDHSAPTLTNCILWRNSALLGDEIYLVNTASLTIRYSNIHGGRSGAYVERSCSLNWDEGNIEAEPLFVDEANADYHLKPTSPCIDAGDPAFDCSKEPAPNRGIVNMGAYGNTSEAVTAIGLAEDDDNDDDDGDDDDGSTFSCLFTSSLQDSPFADKLDVLRIFRDRFLAPNSMGAALIQFYYWASPPMSKFVHGRRPALVAMRATLIPVVWLCEILVKSPEKALAFMSVCVGSAVFIVSIFAITRRPRKRALNCDRIPKGL